MKEFSVHTDLACESELMHDAKKNGVEFYEETVFGFKVMRLFVKNTEGEKNTKKKIGNYITIFCDLLTDIDGEKFDRLSSIISAELHKLINKILEKKPSCVLVAGLGNREITADSIGPKTVDNLTVTRHINVFASDVFKKYFDTPLAAFAPGVLGQTGIETAEMIKGVLGGCSPDLIIAIDALAARCTKRLGATIQISDSGISPGSGIGNRRSEISKSTLGVPTIAIGIPTVVNSATLVYDALTAAGYTDINKNLEKVLNDGEAFFVSPRQIDEISESSAKLLATSIDSLFSMKKE